MSVQLFVFQVSLQSVCLPRCLSACLSPCLHVCLPACLPSCMPVTLSACLHPPTLPTCMSEIGITACIFLSVHMVCYNSIGIIIIQRGQDSTTLAAIWQIDKQITLCNKILVTNPSHGFVNVSRTKILCWSRKSWSFSWDIVRFHVILKIGNSRFWSGGAIT